jgi:hypothetical protein
MPERRIILSAEREPLRNIGNEVIIVSFPYHVKEQ